MAKQYSKKKLFFSNVYDMNILYYWISEIECEWLILRNAVQTLRKREVNWKMESGHIYCAVHHLSQLFDHSTPDLFYSSSQMQTWGKLRNESVHIFFGCFLT